MSEGICHAPRLFSRGNSFRKEGHSVQISKHGYSAKEQQTFTLKLMLNTLNTSSTSISVRAFRMPITFSNSSGEEVETETLSADVSPAKRRRWRETGYTLLLAQAHVLSFIFAAKVASSTCYIAAWGGSVYHKSAFGYAAHSGRIYIWNPEFGKLSKI